MFDELPLQTRPFGETAPDLRSEAVLSSALGYWEKGGDETSPRTIDERLSTRLKLVEGFIRDCDWWFVRQNRRLEPIWVRERFW